MIKRAIGLIGLIGLITGFQPAFAADINEVLAATEDLGLYLVDVAFVHGRRRATLVVTRAGRPLYRADDPPLSSQRL